MIVRYLMWSSRRRNRGLLRRLELLAAEITIRRAMRRLRRA